jgi:SAM-dependent methyltransferase
MTQNIYDDPDFFAVYAQLPRSMHGLEAAGEWPSMRALLPPLDGRHVLDLGCGFGWFCRWARTAGAASVVGIDVSENMLKRAALHTDDPAISYRRDDLETFGLPDHEFDLAYSSLTLHYLRDLPRLLHVVHGALVPGGSFVCSVEHPIYTAPTAPGWVDGSDGRSTWQLDGYSLEGARTTDWLAPGVVKQHRTIGSYIGALLGAGFTLTHLEEWAPTDAQLHEHPEWRAERHRPPFLLLAAVVGGGVDVSS